jgi:hypothetical protein
LDSPHGGGTPIGRTQDGDTQARQQTARRRPARTAALGRSATSSSNRWSHEVTGHSDALDLKGGVFKLTSAKKIAASLKQSAERSSRRKTGAHRSALSMLTSISIAPARTCRRRSASGWSARRPS